MELIRGNTEIMNLGGVAGWETGTGVDLGEPVTSFPASWEGGNQVCDGWAESALWSPGFGP